MKRSEEEYRRTLAYLYGLQYRGIKFGLKNIHALLTACGHPEGAFLVVHVAGTNGKGSTASFIASILQESGYRTGLYTSPHLVDFTERIRINGAQISEEHLVMYARQMRPAFERTQATFFEATTCIAFRYFADEQIDIGVIETGLGGRLDATNVVTPMVCIITNVGMDHMEYLGTTLRSIAREKAGIIKRGVPVITASTSAEVLAVLRSTAKSRRSAFHHMWDIIDTRIVGSRHGCSVVRLSGTQWRIPRALLGYPGAHQVDNAALGVSALSVAAAQHALRRITPGAIMRGLRNVVRNTGLGGRMQTLFHDGVQVTLDVAHNPDGMRVLADTLSERRTVYPIAVFGIVRDKDAGGVLDELRRVAREVIAVSPETERARSSREIVRIATERSILAKDGGSVSGGLGLALKRVHAGNPPSRRKLLVVGSHYLVGEALQFFKTVEKHKKP